MSENSLVQALAGLDLAENKSADYLIEVLTEEEMALAYPPHWNWGFTVEVKRLVQAMRQCSVPCDLRWLIAKESIRDFRHQEAAIIFVQEEKTYPIANCIIDSLIEKSQFISVSKVACIPGMVFLFFDPNPEKGHGYWDSGDSNLVEISDDEADVDLSEDTERLGTAMLNCLSV